MAMILDDPEQVGLLEREASEEVLIALQEHFSSVVVSDWDAQLGTIYHRDDQRTPVGGFLLVKASGIDTTGGGVVERVEINDNNRPFSEEIIATMGARAEENARGARGATIAIAGGSTKYSQTVVRILCHPC